VRIGRALRRAEDAALVLAMATLVGLACGQILLRALFSLTLAWADPLIRHLVLWSGLLGGVVAARQERHIQMGTLARVLPCGWRDAARRVTGLFSGAACLGLTWSAIAFLRSEYLAGTRGVLGLPLWQLELILPAAFGLMALRFLRQAIRPRVAEPRTPLP
jgi:TRAP-type C4-dicarboxylate transport system permease small subunit